MRNKVGEQIMRESAIESHYKKLVEDAGGMFIKFTSPSHNGVPDRIVILPGGTMYFVEFKAPNKKPRPLQRYVIDKIKKLGCEVKVVDRKVVSLE